MAQIFHPITNTISRFSILSVVVLLAAAGALYVVVIRSPYVTEAHVPREQPVPFSHKLHVSGLGIDCRYCHTTAEDTPFGGIPPTKTCMTCHSQIFTDSPILEPVRSSYRTGQSLEWTRVNDLPDFSYFNHSIHVKKGVACVTCHGPVDQMPLAWRQNSLHMEWCLDCHRKPEQYIRPREFVFDPTWQPSEDQATLGRKLVEEYGINGKHNVLMNCSTCHR